MNKTNVNKDLIKHMKEKSESQIFERKPNSKLLGKLNRFNAKVHENADRKVNK